MENLAPPPKLNQKNLSNWQTTFLADVKPILSLIIPAFNEQSIILANVDELASWMKENRPEITYEILVVDDGSTDGMFDILQKAQHSRPWLKIARHKKNAGRGKAIRTGFAYSLGDNLICLDADLSYSPKHINELLDPILNDEADITLASPYHKQGSVKNVPRQRAFLSKMGNKILGLGFNKEFSTVTCIVRGFKREVIEELELVNNDKELHLEIIQKARLLGYRIKEVPAELIWRDRKRHASKKKALPEIAIFKMRKTVLSHLIFNYLTNPGILLLFPIALLVVFFASGTTMILTSFISNLAQPHSSIYQVLRATLLKGQLSLTIVLFSSISLMIFIIFYFLSSQSKKYFEEIYTLMMRMNSKIKRLEDRDY